MSTEKNKSAGAVDMYIPRDIFNSLVSVLSAYIKADNSNVYSKHAERLKKKLLKYGRTFTHNGEENVAVHFYSNETTVIINLLAIYINSTEEPSEDFFLQVGKIIKDGEGK